MLMQRGNSNTRCAVVVDTVALGLEGFDHRFEQPHATLPPARAVEGKSQLRKASAVHRGERADEIIEARSPVEPCRRRVLHRGPQRSSAVT